MMSAVIESQRSDGVRGVHLAPLLLFASLKGMSNEEITQAVGMAPMEPMNSQKWFPRSAPIAILKALQDRSPGTSVGLELGMTVPLTFTGEVGRVARAAPTTRAAMGVFVRCSRQMASDASFSLHEGEEGAWRIAHRGGEREGRVLMEVGLVVAVRWAREVCACGPRLKALHFAHPPFSSREDYEQRLGLPVRFDMPHNELRFDLAVLELPLATHNPYRFEVMMEALRLSEERNKPDAVWHVETTIDACLARGNVSVDAVARRLGRSSRALRRQLAQHGTGMRTLIRDARRRYAKRLLADPNLGLEQVSAQLGYSDARAFRRAFRGWASVSPAEFRKALQPE